MAVLRASGYGPFPLPPYDPYRRNPLTYSYMQGSSGFTDLGERAVAMGAIVTPSLDRPSMDDLHDGRFGLVLLNAGSSALDADDLAVAQEAWLSGRAVVTSGNDTVGPTALWDGTASTGGPGGLVPTQAAVVDHPVAFGWPPYYDFDATRYLTGINPDVVVVGVSTLLGTPGFYVPMVLAAEAPNGRGRWVHIETRCDAGTTPDGLIESAIRWTTATQDVLGPDLSEVTQYRPGGIFPNGTPDGPPGADPSYRLLEDGSYRLLENGPRRLLEN